MTNHLSKKHHVRSCPVLYNASIGGEAFVMGVQCPDVAKRCRAGHFVMVTVRDGIHPVLPRPFSIYRLIGADGRALARRPEPASRGAEGVFWSDVRGLEVLYKVVGDGTELLSRKMPGETVSVMGPCGDGLYAPALPEDDAPPFVLMVSGGVGIVPLLFSAQELSHRKVPMVLFFGGRSRDYLYGIDGFLPLGAEVVAITEDGSRGERGLVTEALGRYLERAQGLGVRGVPLREGAIYACGPEAMLRAVKTLAARYGVPSYLSLERRMGCAMGACRGCVVRVTTVDGAPAYERVCTEGPVFPGERVIL